MTMTKTIKMALGELAGRVWTLEFCGAEETRSRKGPFTHPSASHTYSHKSGYTRSRNKRENNSFLSPRSHNALQCEKVLGGGRHVRAVGQLRGAPRARLL